MSFIQLVQVSLVEMIFADLTRSQSLTVPVLDIWKLLTLPGTIRPTWRVHGRWESLLSVLVAWSLLSIGSQLVVPIRFVFLADLISWRRTFYWSTIYFFYDNLMSNKIKNEAINRFSMTFRFSITLCQRCFAIVTTLLNRFQCHLKSHKCFQLGWCIQIEPRIRSFSM